ncbi:SCO-spondin-like [Mizuhopecten yessoensis]|uniref:SCO-spondin-like n=1 Tax=Mizuhopecten yessoensis TaxID=6573 RepID=UPI000B457853|nr:SCO-spondin-like [Mizuhopecten yessoensis]
MAGPLGSIVIWILFLGTANIWNLANGQQANGTNICDYEETRETDVRDLCRNYVDLVLSDQSMELDMGRSFGNELRSKMKQIVTGVDPKYRDMMCIYKRKEYVKVKKCCKGWIPENKCDIPTCQFPCENEGKCTDVDTCTCTEGWSGYLCQDEKLKPGTNEMYCFENRECYGEKAAGYDNALVTADDCCNSGKAKSWGEYGSPMCNNCDEIADDSNPLINQNTTLNYRTCLAFGKSYFRTFDGLEYLFEGECKYVLAQGQDWSIIIEPFECTSACDCYKKITVLYHGQQLVIFQGKLTINEAEEIPTDVAQIKNGITFLQRFNLWIMIKTQEFRMKVDDKSTVYVTVDKDIASNEEIQGLCGLNNGDASDDFQMRSGQATSNPTTFGNSWNIDENFCPSASAIQPCKDEVEQANAAAACGILRMNTFRDCRNYVAFTTWYQLCVHEYCKVAAEDKEKVRCKVVGAYAHECAQHNIIVSWRNSELCAPECPEGLVYNECISPCQRSCSNLFAELSDECQSKTECVAGCTCPPGLIWQKNECVVLEDCKCSYQDKFYEPYDTIRSDCNECTCVKGQWDCTDEKCSRTASLVGLRHITTFDGKQYSFTPCSCTYTMTKVMDPKIEDRRGKLHIEIAFTDCSVAQSTLGLKCFHYLKMHYKSRSVEMRRNEIFVDSTPIDTNSNKYHLYNSPEFYIKKVTSKFVMVKGFGFQILFDFNQAVYVILDRVFVDQVKGLFGTYNDDLNDDLMMDEGMETTKVPTFTSSYRSQCSEDCNNDDSEYQCSPASI